MKKSLKKLLAVALLVSLVPVAYGDGAKQFLTMLQFQKGLNSQASAYLIGEEASAEAKNVRFNKTYGALAKRNINLQYGSIGAYSVEGLHRYYKADNTKRLVAAGSTKLFVGNDDTGAFQTLGTDFSDGKRWQFLTYKDVAIGVNGYDNPIKYDGKIATGTENGDRTAENLVADLGAPFAGLNSGTALDAGAWYQYKVGFYDGTNYSYSTARSNALLTVAGGIIDYSARANSVTAVGNAAVSSTQKQFGSGSLALDGTGDYLTVPSDQKLSNGSFETWTGLTDVLTNGNMETWTGLTDLLTDGGMETWTNPTTLTNWGLAGNGTLNQEGTQKKAGSWSAKVTKGASGQTVIAQAFSAVAHRGKTVVLGGWTFGSNVSDGTYIYIISDGTGTPAASSYHVFTGQWGYNTASILVPADANTITIYLGVNQSATGAGYFDGFTCYEQLAPTGFSSGGEPGWKISREEQIIKDGSYSVKVESGSFHNAQIPDATAYANKTLVFGAWVYCLTNGGVYYASRTTSGTIVTGSSQLHKGAGWEYLTTTINVGAGTGLVVDELIRTGAYTFYVDSVKAYEQLPPTDWTLSGAGATVAREEGTVKVGSYAAKLTRNGTNCFLYQNIWTALGGGTIPRGKTITFGCWAYQTYAGTAYLNIQDDHGGFAQSILNNTINSWVYLTCTTTVAQTATYVQARCLVYGTDTPAYFDGAFVTDDASANFNFGSGDWTIDTWVNFSALPASNGNYVSFFSQADAAEAKDLQHFYLYNYAGELKLTYASYFGNISFTSSALTLSTGTFYHLELTRNGSVYTIRLNGVSVGTGTSAYALYPSEGVIKIGGDIWGSTNNLNGYLDEFRVSRIARHVADFTPPTAPYTSDSYTTLLLHNDTTVSNITLSDIPIGPAGTTKRIIYRTVGDASRALVKADTTFYKVAEIADNTTTTYADSVADSTIDDNAAPTWATVSAGINATPPKGKIANVHDERLFISGNNTYASDVYWSDSFNPDYFAPESFVAVRPDDGDKVTFLKDQLGILTVGKSNTIQKMYTDGAPSTWSVSNPMSFVGCPAPYSAVNTPEGIFYLSWKGLYKFTGQNSTLISDAVTPEITDILESNIDKAVGFFHKNEYQLAYTSKATGGTLNNRVLVYDLVRDAYSVDTKAIDSFEAFDSGDDFGILYSGSSQTDGYVYADEGSTSVLLRRYKTTIEEGAFEDSRISGEVDSTGYPVGTEDAFWVELAWDDTIDGNSGTIDTDTGIIDRPDLSGTWTSPVYEVNASELTQLQWNEALGSYGDITFAVRSCDDSACSGEAWSSELTNPNGSDLTTLTANKYLQLRATLSTTNINYTPYLTADGRYLFRVFYVQAGVGEEPAIFSVWKSGWKSFGNQGNKKFLQRMRVFYKGDAGTLKVKYENNEGDVSRSFDVDMSVKAEDSTTDGYTGRDDYKVYEHYPEQNSEADPAPTGELWQFTIEHNGNEDWKVLGVEVQYQVDPLY